MYHNIRLPWSYCVSILLEGSWDASSKEGQEEIRNSILMNDLHEVAKKCKQ